MAKVISFPTSGNQIRQEATGSINEFGGIPLDGITGETFLKKQVNPDALYAVNWGGLKNVEELVLILASIGFVFSPKHQHFEAIRHLLDLQNPIIPPTGPQNQ